MTAISKLVAELDMDHSDYDRGMKHVQKEAGALKKFFGGVASTAGGFLAANVIGKGFGLLQDNIGASITAASDLNEAMSAVQTVFGAASKDVAGFSGSVASSLGLSRQEALQVATTFGAMGQQIGLTGNDLSSFSNEMAQAGADLASFYNAPVPEALAAIQSGLQGEAEPLRRFGIFLSDAELNAYAMAKGINKSTAEMTEQEKILLRQNYIMDHLGAAQGDFARTQGGLANQSRILRARLNDLRAQIGAKLLPTVLKITDAANRFLARFDKKRLQGIPVMKALLSSLHTTLNQTFGRETGTKIYNTLRAIIEGIKIAAQVIKTTVAVIVDVVRGLVSAFQWAQDHFPRFFAAVEATARQVIVVIQDIVALVDAIADGDWARAWENFKTLAEDAVKLLLLRLKELPILLMEIFNLALGAIRDVDWGAVADFLLEQGERLIRALYDAARDFFTGTVLPWLRGLPGDILAAMPSLIATLFSHGADLLRGLWRGISGFWNDTVRPWFSRVDDHVKQNMPAVGELLGALYDAGVSILTGLWDGIEFVWENVIAPWFGGIAFTILGAVPSLSTTLWQKGRNLVGGLWNGIEERWNTVKGFFEDIAQEIADLIPNDWGAVGDAFSGLWEVLNPILGAFREIGDFLGIGGGGGGRGGDTPGEEQSQNVGVSFDPGSSLTDIQTWAEDVAAALEPLDDYLIFASGKGGATTNMSMQAPPFKGDGALTAVKRFAKDVWKAFVGMNLDVLTQMRGMKTNVDTQFNAIKTSATAKAGDVRSGVVNEFVGMRNDVERLMQSVKDKITTKLGEAQTQAMTKAKEFKKVGEEIVYQTRDGVGVVAALLNLEVKDTISGARDAANERAGIFVAVGQNMVVGMRNGVSSVAYLVGNAAASAVSSGVGAANSAASAFYYVGQNIAVGIRNGIADTAYIVSAAAAAAVNGAVDAANNAAGNASPSKKMMWTGSMMAEGLAVGINRGVPTVRRAGSNLANAAFVTPGSVSAGAYGSGGGRSIVNYGTIGIEDPDPRKIRDATHATMVGLARS